VDYDELYDEALIDVPGSPSGADGKSVSSIGSVADVLPYRDVFRRRHSECAEDPQIP
jgi:hypothetical protein